MPDKRLKRLRVWRDRLRVHDRNENADIGKLCSGSAVATYDAGNSRATFARVFERAARDWR